jgi:NADPH-dependent ferric siderophore reductase
MARQLGSKSKSDRRLTEKPFADALRMEIAAAGDNHKVLRAIAKNLLTLAQKAELAALPAISAVADRLDGKPAQESTVTIDDRRDIIDYTESELLQILRDCTDGVGEVKH